MKQLIIAVSCCLLLLTGYAQKEKGMAYVAAYHSLAINEMIRSGVPAAITLAQGILESKFGESDLCKQSNNHFGIKCKLEWTGEKVYHDDDTKQECFRSYPDAAASYKDHSDFLKNRPYYTDLFKLDPTDISGWAYGLKKAGYATEKDYPERLLSVIKDYDLNQYTLQALSLQEKKEVPAVAVVANQQIPVKADTTTVSVSQYTPPEEKEEVEIVTKGTTSYKNTVLTATNTYPEGVFSINHAKVIYAAGGSSLLAIANQYDISLSKLLDFNDMDETNILSENKLLFLERKMKKGATDFHIVKPNETLYNICQEEGVRLESILEYNGIKKNMQPLTGEKIYLKSAGPIHPKTLALVKDIRDSNTN